MASALLVGCFGSPAADAVTFLPDDAEVACRAILPNVSADPIVLNSVPEIPALPMVILRPVVLLDLSQAIAFMGGDAGRPVPGLADSSRSPQRLPGRMSPCEPPACIPL